MRFALALTFMAWSCSCAAPTAEAPLARDWSAVVASGAVPAGEDPFALALELSELLGSRDPKLRDECAYTLLAQWIVRQRMLEPEQLRLLAQRWTANLEQGLSSPGDERVLLRSFSVLALALIVARDNQTPFLSREEVDALLERALDYSARERDLRDWDTQLGWIHAVAHTADLLKFLARNPHVDAAGLERILGAVEKRLATPMERAFSLGEDERLARTVAAVILRPEHDAQSFESLLERLRAARTRAAEATPFAAENLAVGQNVLHTLRTLHALLATAERLPPHAVRARDATLRALAQP